MLETPWLQKTGYLLNAAAAGWDLDDLQEQRVALPQCRVFFDFDNTISSFDVLDSLIEHFAIDGQWRVLEQRWVAGEIGSKECLRGQLRSLRATREQLVDYLATIRIDPYFKRILDVLKAQGVHPLIVSDSFSFLIETILKHHDVHGVRILANRLRIQGDRLIPSFPYENPACCSCAHCKTSHLRNEDSLGKVLVYVGDGRSDYCASMQAHVVFAKDSLAEHLEQKGKKFIGYSNLQDVYEALKGLNHG
ncbi:MAG: MtnX-like HAD-IB family phosphatase [Candidatus Omnitrophica bacterium]|nr:MtnX-like HAD-IB family phosphatase [Candidatus Omnitrophota bacterium]